MVKIRVPEKEELESINYIYVESMKDLLKKHSFPEKIIKKVVYNIELWELEYWLELTIEKKGFLFIAEIEETREIVGFIYGQKKNGNLNLGWFSAHFVLPKFQLQGIGKLLLKEGKKFFIEQKIDKLSALTTHAINPIPQSMYIMHYKMTTCINLINLDLSDLRIPDKYSDIKYEIIDAKILSEMDNKKVDYDRSELISRLFKNKKALGIKVDGGYAVLCIEGKSIGPLGASNIEEMRQLVYTSKKLGGVIIRMPENYPQDIIDLVAELLINGAKTIDFLHLMCKGTYNFKEYYVPYNMHG